ncbi:mitofusin-2-like isoform X2 [Antedon mediterranea]|uniref:mitofusin-2-like isoform X2 n=1 Tax=Antedon mediterranea TaxID=105859 RepID=UPI003AF72576
MSGRFTRTNSMAQPSSLQVVKDFERASSPLRVFVDAKKKINGIFHGLYTHIEDSRKFMKSDATGDADIITTEEKEKIDGFSDQVDCIAEILARDNMKVAFFGRTSNGKSTVVNAMMRDKVLPTGIGHTTDCFLSVEASNLDEAYIITPDSEEKKSIQSVNQIAHALSSENLNDQSSMVRVFWPKTRCHLLQNDVVLMDSPGVDVTTGLDEWIDKYCMDADVFVLVSNAESTLMRTEKGFFHKVSEKLSKPNIFILNNRWDAAASEPEFMDAVKQQHLERAVDFLVNELKVVTAQQAEDRIFFVSAKEVLQARIQKQQGGALAEGFQARLFEFENFERKFEECISKSAVITKFEQHGRQGQQITQEIQALMESVYERAARKRASCIEKRKEKGDLLDHITKQLTILTTECKDKIKDISEQAEYKISSAMTEEIRRLHILVDQFDRPFHPDPLVIKVYKEELQKFLEEGLGRNLDARCSSTVLQSLEQTQTQMTEHMSALLPEERQSQMSSLIFRRDFDLSYRLDCRHLCADFKENIQFQFSLGLTAMMNKFLGPKGTRVALTGFTSMMPRHLPPPGPATGTNQSSPDEDVAVAMVSGLASLYSRTSVGLIFIGGIIWKSVGWRILAVAGGMYGGIYMYERLTWTNKAKERTFKRQFVDYSAEKLQLVVNFTSANCSHQIQQELSTTFARLCQEVDTAKEALNKEIVVLDAEKNKLEKLMNDSKLLRNRANWLESELMRFIRQYLGNED